MATYEKVKEAADYIKSKIDYTPKIAIICGSGLSKIGSVVEESIVIQYKSIPSFVTTSVQGHKNQLVLGKIKGKHVVCMQGRFHPYEGYEAWVPAFPVRVFKTLGCEVIIVTNAAGGLDRSYTVGDFMLLQDHISYLSLGGYTPLKGHNVAEFGPRFPSMINAYDKDLREQMKKCAAKLNYDFVREGVYVQVAGPSYETIAEIKMVHASGGNAVGMSTVQEVIAARHCGLKVVACSLITNKCIMDYEGKSDVCHEEVLETANRRGDQMVTLIGDFIQQLDV